ncbi:MAG: hypothetical protein KGL39_35400 [Patescibacteria group bacterium]|nr:hypothetical protein [Patescibacteria group bacterium]
MERAPIPFKTFPSLPISWGTEPTPASSSPAGLPAGVASTPLPSDSGYANRPVISVVSISFGARATGVNGLYPIATRVATQGFTTPIGLLTASLASSIVNASTDTPVLIILARDVGASLNVLTGSDVLVAHVCEQGLGHSMRSGAAFADDIAPKYGANQNIALYVCQSGTNAAGSASTAVAVLRYFSFA